MGLHGFVRQSLKLINCWLAQLYTAPYTAQASSGTTRRELDFVATGHWTGDPSAPFPPTDCNPKCSGSCLKLVAGLKVSECSK